MQSMIDYELKCIITGDYTLIYANDSEAALQFSEFGPAGETK